MNNPIIIESCQGFPSDIIRDDHEAKNNIWREVTEEHYWDLLGAVPPIDMKQGSFLLGEPYDFAPDNDTYYYGCVEYKGRYFSRIVARKKFDKERAELIKFLNHGIS